MSHLGTTPSGDLREAALALMDVLTGCIEPAAFGGPGGRGTL